MRVRMLTGLSGPAYSLARGDEREFSDAEAIRLVEAGYAVPVADTGRETATRPAPPEKREPFGGKGDHDGDGKVGGAKPPVRKKAASKARG